MKKDYNNFRVDPFKMENEPEEGEIVDDYDLIVSSDEELCMRQRIRELEAENEEIEQIAVISRSYVNKINHAYSHFESSRAAKVPTDASSISSTEFVTPKKRKRRKSREHKRKHCHRLQQDHSHLYEQQIRHNLQEIPLKVRLKRSHCKRRQKMFAKKQKQINSDRFTNKEVNLETLSIESPESSESSYSLADPSKKCSNRSVFKRKDTFDNDKYITRDTLRLAVARNTNESRIPLKKSCLKDKLLKQDAAACTSNKALNYRKSLAEGVDIESDNDEDDDVQVIENEPDIQAVDEESTDSMEEKELRLIALKSAVLKKHMARKLRNAEVAYSPTDFDEMSSDFLRQDEKLNDIDEVDLEGEDSQAACATVSPETSPHLMMLDDQDESQQMVDCKPVDMDIANSDSEDAAIGSWTKEIETTLPKFSLESNDIVNKIHYGFYVQEVHDLPPPPPGVDDYEGVPPPPPYHMPQNAENQDMDLDNEELAADQHRIGEKLKDILDVKYIDADKAIEYGNDDDFEDKEEEEALRALLLSKFQSPKNQKRKKRSKEVNACQNTSIKNETSEQFNCKAKPTEIILKEAVKRLKIHSQTELCKEEILADFSKTNKVIITYKPPECDENDGDSLNLLQKLKNRLNKYKTQSEYKNADEDNIDESAFEKKEVNETATSPYNEANIENTINTNITEATSIDISDITRRLQIIKENVFNSTFNPSPQDPSSLDSAPKSVPADHAISECLDPKENHTRCNQPSTESICQLNKPLTNNSVNIAGKKMVKSNFDVDSNQTTFKITITNNAAFKTEVNDTTNKMIDVTYKEENNSNNDAKTLVTKLNQNSKNKDVLKNDGTVKNADEMKKSSVENNANKPISIAIPRLNDKKVTPIPTYSLIRTTKIVKPNKVINANPKIDLNSRQVTQTCESKPLLKPSKPETNNPISNMSENSRLITSLDQVKHMCTIAPFIISVQNSSNESSNDEEGGTYDSLYKPFYDYNDNASPLSLNLESPSRTPLRSNSPTENSVDGSTTHIDSDALNLKRQITSVCRKNIINKTVQTNVPIQAEKRNKTPLAVRHLPTEAQSEYRRLVHRMKLLENKRKFADIEENKKEFTTDKQNGIDLPNVKDSNKDKVDQTNSELNTTLVKKVLLRNTSNNTSSIISTNEKHISNGPSSSSKMHKSNVLRSYENLYIKFGAGIVNNLDKSLKLVEEAKKAKIDKLKLETRLKELKAEMDILQVKHKEEQEKITRIYPSICTTNEVLTSLKQKRSKVFKAALNLGKTLKGEAYRLNNDLKESITTKSKKLAAEIKIVNSLKAQDAIKIEDVTNTSTTEQKTDNKKLEDCRTKSNGECLGIKLNTVSDTNNTIVRSGKNKPMEEENNLETPFKKEFGGNKEFQSLKSNNSTNHNNNGHACQPSEVTYAESENGSKQTLSLSTYISPLVHLRNIDSTVDPNGVICPYDLMGNCEDATCKYVHIATKPKI